MTEQDMVQSQLQYLQKEINDFKKDTNQKLFTISFSMLLIIFFLLCN